MIFVVWTMNVEFMFKSENDTSLPQGKKITCRTREINSIFNATNIGFFFFNYIFLVLAYVYFKGYTLCTIHNGTSNSLL